MPLGPRGGRRDKIMVRCRKTARECDDRIGVTNGAKKRPTRRRGSGRRRRPPAAAATAPAIVEPLHRRARCRDALPLALAAPSEPEPPFPDDLALDTPEVEFAQRVAARPPSWSGRGRPAAAASSSTSRTRAAPQHIARVLQHLALDWVGRSHRLHRGRQLARDRPRHGPAARAPRRAARAQRPLRRRARLERPPHRGRRGRVARRRAAGRRDRDRLRRSGVRRRRRRRREPGRRVPAHFVPRLAGRPRAPEPCRRAPRGASRERAPAVARRPAPRRRAARAGATRPAPAPMPRSAGAPRRGRLAESRTRRRTTRSQRRARADRDAPARTVTLDALANALKARGFSRPPGSPRLITRLRRIRELQSTAPDRSRSWILHRRRPRRQPLRSRRPCRRSPRASRPSPHRCVRSRFPSRRETYEERRAGSRPRCVARGSSGAPATVSSEPASGESDGDAAGRGEPRQCCPTEGAAPTDRPAVAARVVAAAAAGATALPPPASLRSIVHSRGLALPDGRPLRRIASRPAPPRRRARSEAEVLRSESPCAEELRQRRRATRSARPRRSSASGPDWSARGGRRREGRHRRESSRRNRSLRRGPAMTGTWVQSRERETGGIASTRPDDHVPRPPRGPARASGPRAGRGRRARASERQRE